MAAQIKALGLIINVLTEHQVSEEVGMIIGTLIVVSYTTLGGMLSVAILDFIQMLVIISGLLFISYIVSDMSGGVMNVLDHARENNKFDFWRINLFCFYLCSHVYRLFGNNNRSTVFSVNY